MSDTKSIIPTSLREALQKGEVVPFVGAGASMTVRKKNDDGTQSNESLFPSWKGFVEILADTLREEGKSEESDYVLSSIKIKKPKYLDALQHAQEELGLGDWYKFFDKSFNKTKNEAHEDSFKLNELIWKLSNNLIITTNIDRIFQWTCPQAADFKLLDVQNVEYAALQTEKIPQRPTVWYLHGHIDHKEKVVFTRQQFDSFYKQKDNEAKLQTLINLLTQRTFLFIGFSLDDDYLRELLEYIHNLYQGGADAFYILFRERDITSANFPEYVKPVPFSDFGKPLEDLIEELIKIAEGDGVDKKDDPGNNQPDLPDDTKKDAKKPFFNIPYNSKGTEFVGRTGKIEEIWELLNREGCASIGQAVSVKGLGGFGKTQLAVEYAHAYRDKYPNGVFWVVADQNIDNQLLQIAQDCGWIIKDDQTVNQFEIAKAKFRALSDCLILFDNVETYADIADYLPKSNPQTHLLITSRGKQPQFKQIDLELLKRDESRKLLLKISKRDAPENDEAAHLEQVLEILGDIPLAVELVGGYLADYDIITFAKYHQYLNEVPLDKLEKEFPKNSFTDHDRSIIQTLRISEKTVNEKPLMVEILKVLAWSGSSSMGISLLQALVETDDETNEAEKEFNLNNALAEAHKLRLLKKDEDAERYAIHRLLAKVIRHEKPLENEKEWQTKIVKKLTSWFGEKANRFENLTDFETEIEHLEVWQEQTINSIPVEAIQLTQLRGNIPRQRGNYQLAFDWFQKAVNIFENENLDNKKLLSDLFNDLGIIYENLGNYNTAIEYFKKALELRKKLLGENHFDTTTSYNNLGSIYGELGDHQKALEYQKKALELRKKLLGENHFATATSYNNVGGTYRNLGNYNTAIEYFKKALELRKKLLGENHPNTATSYNNLGLTYGDLGNHQKALEYQKKSLELLQKLFGEKHPDTAMSYNNVGSTYGDLGNHRKALEYQKKSLELLQKLFGEKHPDTAMSYNNVGTTYGDLSNHQKALEYKEKALKIHQELLGKQHPNTILILRNVINTYLKLGDKEKAGRKAAEFFSFIPQNHPDWKWFEEISHPYRPKKNRHKKKR